MMLNHALQRARPSRCLRTATRCNPRVPRLAAPELNEGGAGSLSLNMRKAIKRILIVLASGLIVGAGVAVVSFRVQFDGIHREAEIAKRQSGLLLVCIPPYGSAMRHGAIAFLNWSLIAGAAMVALSRRKAQCYPDDHAG
jgi:hypothetical protein